MDVLEALALPGVEDVITAADVPGSNLTAIYGDEELFAVDKVGISSLCCRVIIYIIRQTDLFYSPVIISLFH